MCELDLKKKLTESTRTPLKLLMLLIINVLHLSHTHTPLANTLPAYVAVEEAHIFNVSR